MTEGPMMKFVRHVLSWNQRRGPFQSKLVLFGMWFLNFGARLKTFRNLAVWDTFTRESVRDNVRVEHFAQLRADSRVKSQRGNESREISVGSQTGNKADWGCSNLSEVWDDWKEGQRCWKGNLSDPDRWQTVAEVGDEAYGSGRLRGYQEDKRKVVAFLEGQISFLIAASHKCERHEWTLRLFSLLVGAPKHNCMRYTHGLIKGLLCSQIFQAEAVHC